MMFRGQMVTYSHVRRWICGPLQPGYHIWSDGRVTVVLHDGLQANFSAARLKKMKAEMKKEEDIQRASNARLAQLARKEIYRQGPVHYY